MTRLMLWAAVVVLSMRGETGGVGKRPLRPVLVRMALRGGNAGREGGEEGNSDSEDAEDIHGFKKKREDEDARWARLKRWKSPPSQQLESGRSSLW